MHVKIDGRQFGILVIMNVLGTAIIVVPSIAATYASQNGWVSVLIATLFGLLFVSLFASIYRNQPDKSFFEQMEDTFGKWIGKMTSLLFMFFVFDIAIGNLRVMGDFITTQILVETPIEVIMMLAIIVSHMAVRNGLEVIARSGEIFFPYVVVSILTLILVVLPESEITNIQPVLQSNLTGTLVGTIPLLGYPFLELVILLVIIKDVKREHATKNFILGTLIGGLLLTLVTLFCLLVLGVDITSRNVYPTYVLGKKISIANFLERVEILVAIIWFFTIFFKITTCFYVLSQGIKQIFQLSDYKTITYPLAYSLLVFAVFVYDNVVQLRDFISSTWIPVSITFGLILPISVYFGNRVKKKLR